MLPGITEVRRSTGIHSGPEPMMTGIPPDPVLPAESESVAPAISHAALPSLAKRILRIFLPDNLKRVT